MKKLFVLFLLMHLFICAEGQDLEVVGKAKVTVMDPATNAAQQVAREPDGTLALMSAMTPTYAIGDFAHGGVVFWVTPSGEHGRVVSLFNVSGVGWSNITTTIGTSAQSDLNGPGNSVAIISQDGHVNSAAKQCLDFAFAGYDDWYLPSKIELNQIYSNRVVINATATANGGEALAETSYWSSTESDVDGSEAWNQSFFGLGAQLKDSKNAPFTFRAVRAF
jgi:hypothetical protein